MPPPHTPAIERIERRISVEDRGYSSPCWIYTGTLDPHGYGRIGVRRATNVWLSRFTHRIVWEHYSGPIPTGLGLDHLCRVPACCRPDHLEPVTQRENNVRGVGPDVTRARHALRTHCKRGHELTDENVYFRAASNTRNCRTCRRQYRRARRGDTRAALAKAQRMEQCSNCRGYGLRMNGEDVGECGECGGGGVVVARDAKGRFLPWQVFEYEEGQDE